MTTLYGESSQLLERSGVTNEEHLFYAQNHLIGKRVRSLRPIVSLSEILTYMEASARSTYIAGLW